jgi:hypothetical protein
VEVALNFQGATVGTDFTTDLPGYSSGTSASVAVADGDTQESFQVSILNDTEEEGLEILTIDLAESIVDTNSDGFGEAYGFVHGGVVIPIADAPYDWWRYHHFGAFPPLPDSDADGLNILWEYFVQSDPDSPMASLTEGLTAINATIDTNQIMFDIPKTIPTDARFVVEASPTPTELEWSEVASRIGNGLWTVAEGYVLNTDTAPPTHDTVTMTLPTALRAFQRFRIEAIPSP